jgi:hypothetical protein
MDDIVYRYRNVLLMTFQITTKLGRMWDRTERVYKECSELTLLPAPIWQLRNVVVSGSLNIVDNNTANTKRDVRNLWQLVSNHFTSVRVKLLAKGHSWTNPLKTKRICFI